MSQAQVNSPTLSTGGLFLSSSAFSHFHGHQLISGKFNKSFSITRFILEIGTKLKLLIGNTSSCCLSVCDASFRLTIFGAWMYTLNDGVFSTKMTVAYYYIIVILMIVLNIVFTWLEGDMEPCLSIRSWIGKDEEFASISH